LPAPAIENSIIPMELREFKLFRTLVHERTGIWLRDGKQVMLGSRLSRRLRHHGLANFADYCAYVQQVQDNRGEIRELINCVTTNKTSFFRERHHFEYLANTVVPQIQSASRPGTPGTSVYGAPLVRPARNPTRSRLRCLKRYRARKAPSSPFIRNPRQRGPGFRDSSSRLAHGRLRSSRPTSTQRFWKQRSAQSIPRTRRHLSTYLCIESISSAARTT